MGSRRRRIVAAAVTAVVVLVGVTVAVRLATDDEPAGDLWRRIDNAFTAPFGATASATVLMWAPNGCFHAVGPLDAGNRRHTAQWSASGRCDAVRREWPAEVPPSAPELTERQTIVDAVAQGGEWVTVAAVTAGNRAWGEALHGTPGQWRSAQLGQPLDDAGDVPTAVGFVDNQYTAVGRHGDRPAVYTSSGGSWGSSPLPVPADGTAQPLGVAGAPGRPGENGTGVIIGRAGRGPVVWSIGPGSTGWQVRDLAEAAELTDVVHDGTAYVAVGVARDGAALVLTSPDGVSWAADSRAVPPGTPPFRTVHALRPPPADVAVLGREAPPALYAVGPTDRTDQQCATVWRRDATAWVPEPLGCHGIPTSLLRLADGRTAAVSGTILWLRRP